MIPREVVNDGVRKNAVGYHSGHTQFCILREHGLIKASRGMSHDADLTKKGKRWRVDVFFNGPTTNGRWVPVDTREFRFWLSARLFANSQDQWSAWRSTRGVIVDQKS